MLAKQLKCSECDSTQFVTQPDSYSVYEAKGNKLRFVSAELTHDKDKLYCRECSAELDTQGVEFI